MIKWLAGLVLSLPRRTLSVFKVCVETRFVVCYMMYRSKTRMLSL